MGYKIFLDDVLSPGDVDWISLPKGSWAVCQSYQQFKNMLECRGLPDFISFDYALDEDDEKNGYDCARALAQYCIDFDKPLPRYAVHSMNPIVKKTILAYLETVSRHLRDRARLKLWERLLCLETALILRS